MRIEYSVERPKGGGYYYSELELPASRARIRDAQQKARLLGRETQGSIEVLECRELPELTDIRLDSPTAEELNFFAGRLKQLPPEELLALNAVLHTRNEDGQYEDGLTAKELINMTYGLDNVMIAANVSDIRQLGQFAIANDLNDDVLRVPEGCLYLLDMDKIGRLQQKTDDGVFWKGHYFAVGGYEPPEVYDGMTLPEEPEEQEYVFRLEITEPASQGEAQHEWITLPMEPDGVNDTALSLQENAMCCAFESAIPQITGEMQDGVRDLDTLNRIAKWYQAAPEMEQIKLKAILEGNRIGTIQGALDAATEIDRYELAYECDSENDYFREFLCRHLDAAVDPRWLDNVQVPQDAKDMVYRTGAVYSDYGIVSARDGHLFEPIPFEEPMETASQREPEQYAVIEVLGQTALFSNGRIAQKDLPDGLYKYDLRHGDSGDFETLEPRVIVNHAGTVITKEPIDFGDAGSISFDEESSPNFVGEDMTLEEFADADFTENEGMGMRL